MIELSASLASAGNVKPDLCPPSPFDVVTAQAAHEDDWARFPPAWPHLVVIAESTDGLVYGIRMRHLDGTLTQVGRTCADLYEAKLRLERLYIELALAGRMRGGFYADDHVRQCCSRLATLETDACPSSDNLRRLEALRSGGSGPPGLRG